MAPDSAPSAPHALPVTGVAEALGVDPNVGLTSHEARRRLAEVGRNELAPPHRVSLLASLVDAATEPFVVLLAFAGGLALVLGEVRDGLLILVGLIPIVAADVITEFRAERALEELRRAAAPRAVVRRDGRSLEVAAADLVPGDVVLLHVGDVLPADVRLVRTEAMLVDRSVLTGESLPEEGRVEPDLPGVGLAERHSIAYSGTAIVQGRGLGIVVATGPRSELGRIAGALGQADRGRSPLQRELDRLVRILLAVAIGLIVITVGMNLVRGSTVGEALLAGISAAIAAIPEEPPVLVAVVLGLGAYRLLRRGVLVRRLNAQETLGAVDLIVTDKTGTLTQNRLALEVLLTPEGEVTDPDRRAALLLDALRAEEDAWGSSDAPVASFTRSIRRALADGAPPNLDRTALVAAEPPREDAPYSRTLVHRDGHLEELVIGAPEAVLALAGETPEGARWHQAVDASASAGRRLLLLAGRRDGAAWTLRAIVAFADPLRPGIPEAMHMASEAGIRVIIVTGDHPTTAAAIARAAGLSGQAVVTGRQVDAMDEGELARTIARFDIVARATPDQKLRLVRAARDGRRTVAVTGDGVNDAPALQQADVAVAMGSGTAVAREAADLVLGDDSFVTLMEGLREGRRIVANVQKGLVFLTSTHVALLGFILIATIVGYGQPLLPIQILWAELFIDLAASVAFEREPAEPDIMRRPPRPRSEPLLTDELLARISVAGGVTAVAVLALMAWHNGGQDHARWLAFTALVFGQLVRAYMNRSLTHPIRELGPNGFLLGACLVAGVVTLLIPYVPPLADAFRATPLDATDLGLVALVALGPAVVAEVVRSTRRTTWVA